MERYVEFSSSHRRPMRQCECRPPVRHDAPPQPTTALPNSPRRDPRAPLCPRHPHPDESRPCEPQVTIETPPPHGLKSPFRYAGSRRRHQVDLIDSDSAVTFLIGAGAFTTPRLSSIIFSVMLRTTEKILFILYQEVGRDGPHRAQSSRRVLLRFIKPRYRRSGGRCCILRFTRQLHKFLFEHAFAT